MTQPETTQTERDILLLLDSFPRKLAAIDDIARRLSSSEHGVWPILGRMQAKSLVSHCGIGTYEITFLGMQVVKTLKASNHDAT